MFSKTGTSFINRMALIAMILKLVHRFPDCLFIIFVRHYYGSVWVRIIMLDRDKTAQDKKPDEKTRIMTAYGQIISFLISLSLSSFE